eukprot:5961483-Pleurochrysis_carterae.AAC.2
MVAERRSAVSHKEISIRIVSSQSQGSLRKRVKARRRRSHASESFGKTKLKRSIVKSFGKQTKTVKRQVIYHSKSVHCMRGEHSQVEREISQVEIAISS